MKKNFTVFARPRLQAIGVVGSILSVSLMAVAQTDEMRSLPRTTERSQPDDWALKNETETQKQLDAVTKELDKVRSALEAGQPPAMQNPLPENPLPGSPMGEPSAAENSRLPEPSESVRAPKAQTDQAVRTAPSAQSILDESRSQKHRSPSLGSPLQVFHVERTPLEEGKAAGMTVLPIGSHVKARVVSGVEANAREPYPVLLQLDYAFSGPNHSQIDLSHCFMIAKARANLSTERVMMETDSLSCVREDGEHFKREAKGYVAGEDNTFGATGTFISKQSQVLLAAVLASIAKNAGQAIADAQKTTSLAGADRAATASNVTGSQAAFVAGSSLVDGASMVAQWYLEQAKELIPSIGVGSGQDVFVIMLDTLAVPKLSTEEEMK